MMSGTLASRRSAPPITPPPEPWRPAHGVAAPGSLRFLTFVIWAVAAVWVHRLGLYRAYGDAISHELIARRVFDSISPGLAQLGTVWLPLPPIMLMPLVIFDPIWRAGIAGAIVGGIYMQVSASSLYRIGATIGGTAVGWVAALVFITNPNILYLFSTPLTEGPSFMFLCLCGASMASVLEGLARKEARPSAILAASGFAGAMLLCRYDGWMLALVCGLMILIFSYLRFRRRMVSEAVSLAYLVTPASAIVLWLLYNLIIFGDAFSFLRGQYSSAGIVEDLAVRGVIPTRNGKPPEVGQPLQAIFTYLQAVAENVGLVASILALAGFMIALLYVRKRPAMLVCIVLAAPLIFYIVALTAGQSLIITRAVRPNGIFNVRYGALVAPLIAICIGTLATPLRERTWRLALPIGVVAIAGNLLLLGEPLGPVVVAEGRLQQRAITYTAAQQAAHWFATQPHTGQILLDDALEPQAQIVLVEGGRPVRDYIGSSTPELWRAARVTPPPQVNYIVVLGPKSRDRPNDRVAKDLLQPDNTIVGFIPIFNNGEMMVFVRG